MWLIAGLGNPGSEYAGTRHNLGFEVIELLSNRWRIDLSRSGFDGRYGKGQSPRGGEVVLLEPLTFMNLSGQSVLAAMQFFKVGPDRLVVAVDDLALPPGTIRVRTGGSAGGHKGLIDIIARLGHEDFGRIRLGIGSPPPGWAGRDYVLSRPALDDRRALDEAVREAGDAVDVWMEQGAETAMNRFNRSRQNRTDGPTEQG
ncbi:MAG: aminoacyl-tRNA hydrolase [Phycisphaerae bacterium]|nr:aminoacyl-tRNA hydrolase [Phycisphaerae bacterium]